MRRLGLSVLLALVFSSEAVPCTVKHVLSAKEIVGAASVIVRAKATRHEPGKGPYEGFGDLVFEVAEELKGQWPSRVLKVSGQVKRYHGSNDGPVPYDFVRPGGRLGSCFASDYKLGAEYLLFLLKGDLYWAPLSATNEQVSGGNDPWVVWVRAEARSH